MSANRRAPSAQAIADAFRLTEEEGQVFRDLLKRCGMRAIKFPGFFGVETVHDSKGRAVFSYLNSGDTYSPTIIRRAGSDLYRISTMGDEIESLERQGVKLP